MKPIKDHITKDLAVLFVGFNPSVRSGKTGHHFANPNNRFWKILFEAGLTPRKFTAQENSDLLNLGYGLTNIVARPTKAADEITTKLNTIVRALFVLSAKGFTRNTVAAKKWTGAGSRCLLCRERLTLWRRLQAALCA